VIGQPKHPHDTVALTVVRFLGIASIIGLLVVGGLCYVALQYEGDGSTIAVVAIVGNLASAALASLGSILASTGKGTPQPVTVENTPKDPVPVEPSGPTPTPVIATESEFA
jgi:hypothetical protein